MAPTKSDRDINVKKKKKRLLDEISVHHEAGGGLGLE
jgi:hypothetical protein